MKSFALVAILPALMLAGCATVPSGPRVMALPGTGKSFNEFQTDNVNCRQYAARVIGQTAAESSDAAVRDAVVSTAIGAVAGAAIGGRQGASIGAGTGLIFGSVTGSETQRLYGYEAQYRYDEAYVQCMYANGHKVPVPAAVAKTLEQTPKPIAPNAPAAPTAPVVAGKASTPSIPPPPPFAPPPSPPPDYTPSKKSR